MNITVLGLWHLGCVTAACSARYFNVTGLDFDKKTISNLLKGKTPIEEPGLNDLIITGLQNKSLTFISNKKEACPNTDILWVCYDTPVDKNDRPDPKFVIDKIKLCIPHLSDGTIVLISSQLPVGTCKKLESDYPHLNFACSPENLRLGKALDIFQRPERIVIGARSNDTKRQLKKLFSPFCSNLIFMTPESAEMTKHALNGFLALSISYMNEIARLCELTGATAKEVEAGLKSDFRIGPHAYLSPGQAFSGGTLARDVVSLHNTAASREEKIYLIPSIKKSNDWHKNWTFQKIKKLKRELNLVNITVFGLTYKPFTNTLRRSGAVELCEALIKSGFEVSAFDPVVRKKDLSNQLSQIRFCKSAEETITQADALVISTPWPSFKDLPWEDLVMKMKRRVILDPASFLKSSFENFSVQYLAVGLPYETV